MDATANADGQPRELGRLADLLRRARKREAARRLADAVWASLVIVSALLAIAIVLGAWLTIDLFATTLIGGAVMMMLIVLVRLVRTPDALATAISLDRLNHTSELLSTAWATRREDNPWITPIRAMANQACDTVRLPRAIGRFSPRLHLAAWTGLICVLVAGVLFRSEPTKNDPTNHHASIAMATPDPESQPVGAALNVAREATTDAPLPGDPSASQTGSGDGLQRPSNRGDDAAGAGQSSEGVAGKLPNETSAAANPFDRLLPPIHANAGQGPLATQALPGNARGGSVNNNDPTSAIAPWDASESWSASRQLAAEQIIAGRVPEAHRDLVRRYFDR